MSTTLESPRVDNGPPDEPPERDAPRDEQAGGDRAWRDWMMVAVGLAALLSVLGIIVSVVALSSVNSNSSSAATPAAPAKPAAAAVAPLAMTLSVKADDEHGRLGPDHKWHDAFLPADFKVKAGQTVTVTVNNYDGGPHSFTSPSLNVNQAISGGGSLTAPSKATFTFTAPTTPGAYQWWCGTPCDPWAMSHDGYMRGVVTVTA
jgi:plastocyanin